MSATRTVVDLSSGEVSVVTMGESEIAQLPVEGERPNPRFVPLDFLDLFTESEQLAVAQAAMVNSQVKLWYDRMLAATYITIDDPRTVAGIQALVIAGLITQSRADAVVAAMHAP